MQIIIDVNYVIGDEMCYPPYIKLGNICFFIVRNEQKTFMEARQHCRELGGDTITGDLLTTPKCNDFTLLSKFLSINGLIYIKFANLNSNLLFLLIVY